MYRSIIQGLGIRLNNFFTQLFSSSSPDAVLCAATFNLQWDVQVELL